MSPCPPIPRSWRDALADEVLAAEAAGGYGEHALLGGLRTRRPGVCTLKVPVPDFGRYGDFLRGEAEGLRPMLSGTHEERDDRGRISHTIAWHAYRWKGEEIELVVVPDSHRRSVVAVGRSPEVLGAFAQDLADFCARPAGRALVYSSGAWRPDAGLDAELGKVSWEDVVLPDAQKAEIRAAVEGFFSRPELYRSLGFAWRRGVLLVGPPGTGKTMVCKAAASALPGTPFLYVRDLSGYDPEDSLIGEVFERARALSPCVLVLEDVDGFVGDRNRAVFLNELDGFRDNDGMLVLASSNHPERVDEALLRRPSRFDRVFRIGPPAEAERRRYCLGLLAGLGPALAGSGAHEAEGLAAEVARETSGFTPAHLKEAFLGAALERAHEGAELGYEAYARAVLEHVGKIRRYMSESRNPARLAEGTRSSLGFGAD